MKKHKDYSVTDISEFHDLIHQTEQKLSHELDILPILIRKMPVLISQKHSLHHLLGCCNVNLESKKIQVNYTTL